MKYRILTAAVVALATAAPSVAETRLHYHPCKWANRAHRQAVCIIDVSGAPAGRVGIQSGSDAPTSNGCFAGGLIISPDRKKS